MSHPTDKIQHIISAWKGHDKFALRLVQHMRPQVIVDLGVDYGFSTCALALVGIGTVYGVDWFQGDAQAGYRDTEQQVRHEIDALGFTNIELIKGDFAEVAKTWQQPIDILHIDGAHEYEIVKRDYEAWAPFVKKTGIILMHDTESFPLAVGKYFMEIAGFKYNAPHSSGLGMVAQDAAVLEAAMRLV